MTRSSSFRDFRQRADAVRSTPLAVVLTGWGAQSEPRDRSQWRTEQGRLSITGAKFFNWNRQQGGGGAIDLVMHLSGWAIRASVEWLEQQMGAASTAMMASSDATCHPEQFGLSKQHGLSKQQDQAELCLPVANLSQLPRVRKYLTDERCLAADILHPLLDKGKVYADDRGNAVFLMVAGKINQPIGAELRGTSKTKWRGLAPGTRKDAGYFWIGRPGSKKIILCEGAIDAISCFQLYETKLDETKVDTGFGCICISTAGVRSNPPWLMPLLARRYDIHCGFDDDDAGDAASCRLIARHPEIKRLRPPAHDWNDALLLR